MIIYSGVKSDFMEAVENASIASQIKGNIYEKMHRIAIKQFAFI